MNFTRWQAALVSQISHQTTLQKVDSHDFKPISILTEIISCILDVSILRDAIDAANVKGELEIEDFVEFDESSFILANVLDLEGRLQRTAVSFHRKNGLTGNLRNAEVNSTCSFLSEFASSFWTKTTGFELGSTVSSNLVNSWNGSVTSYLSNGRDPARFHFVHRDDYLLEPFREPEGDNLTHLPVDLKDIALLVNGAYLELGAKPDLGLYAKRKRSKKVFKFNGLRLGFDKTQPIETELKYEKCLLDSATANPLIDVDKVKYFPGFAKLIFDPRSNTYTLRIPIPMQRSMKTVKSKESRDMERKNRFHSALPCNSF
jgi:hypothetical protein